MKYKILDFLIKHFSDVNIRGNITSEDVIEWLKMLAQSKSSEDLEEAANIYANKQGLELKPFARRFFIAGAKWQKEKMMESAIDAKIVNDEMMVECEQGCLVLDPLTYPIGQKLKILIIKEDE